MISDFYKSIFPSIGLRALAVFKDGLKKPPTHSFYDNDDDLLEAADTYNQLGKNVYHGCAVYKTSENRKGENVLAIQALWADLDCGEGKAYPTQRDAVMAFETFRVKAALPVTHILSSGRGVHIYLPLTKPILPDQWDRLAAIFAQCMDHAGVKHDASRTQDKASVLRIPGTNNFKTTTTDVTIKRMGVAEPAAIIYKTLKAYADASGLIIGEVKTKGKPQETNDLIGNKDFPPAEGDLILEKCAVLKDVADTGGDCDYDVWWPAMGVAAHTTKPDEVAIHWTRNRAATGHEKNDWQGAIEQWKNFGPATCEKFKMHAGSAAKCATCEFSGKIGSPIRLGVPEQPHVAPLPTAVVPKPLKVWGFAEEWIKNDRAAKTYTGTDDAGRLTRSEKNLDGTYKWVPFCNRYWQVLQRVRVMDGTYQLEIGYLRYPGQPYETFFMDSADVLSPEKVKAAFSARELHIYGGPKSIDKAMRLLMTDQELLASYQLEAEVHNQFGWVTHNKTVNGALTGDFVLGDTVFRPKEAPKQIVLDPNIPANLRDNFTTSGTTAEWVNFVNRVYNRPGAEAYQFVILTAFAAPLVKLTPSAGMWHGIPTVLGGDSGAAKTSTALAAMSVYTNPTTLKFNAGKQGDTLNALSLKMAAVRNLPYVMDEMTNQDSAFISNVLYMTANGMPRDRMNQNGQMQENQHRWDTLGIVTSNDALHEVLEAEKNQHTQDAGKLRSFQVNIKESDLKHVFAGVTRSEIEEDFLGKLYGEVGRTWIQFLVDNRIKVENAIGITRRAYNITPNDRTNLRFYKDLLVMVRVAGDLARAKGLLHFDMGALMKWAEKIVLNLSTEINHKDWDSHISEFVASLHGRTIVTSKFREGRGRRHDVEMPRENLSSNTVAVARRAVDDKRFIVVATAMKDWCRQYKIMPSEMITQMVAKGFLQTHTDPQGNITANATPINIGSGSTIPRPRATCYEFVYSAVTFEAEDDKVKEGNVIPLVATSTVTDSVTEPQNDEGAALATP